MEVMETEKRVFICDLCKKAFNRKCNLQRHLVTHSNPNRICEKENCQIRCVHCFAKFRTRRQLLYHYASDHGEEFMEETVSFPSQSEFKEWKRQTENIDQCYFVSARGAQKGANDSKKWYLLCHRDGFYKSSVNPRQKKLKKQGTNKIYGSCGAQMIVTEDSQGMVTVRYVRTHVGHSSNVGRLKLSTEERASIAGKIREGVPFDEILNQIRKPANDVGKSNVLACLTKQDLRNIERDFHLIFGHDRANDFISVQLWYEKVSQLPDDLNPVVYFKPQGSCEENSLESDDILLIIATKFQISTLLRYGSNVIYVDSIHGPNMYDFHLTSVVVVDDDGNAIPAAFCISNKKDSVTWTVFFEKLYELVGFIRARVFMSDVDDSLYSAWVTAMAPATTRFLCTWYVDRAWKTNLQTLIADKEIRALVYKRLRALVKEVRVENFHALLDGFLRQIKEDDRTAPFASYFEQRYAKRVNEWAHCYRQFGDLNTYAGLENLHKELKCCYAQGRRNKRLDKAIDALLKVARDQMFRGERKTSNECRRHEEAIRQSHQKAVASLRAAQIHRISASVWKVTSASNENVVYEVTKIAENSKVCSDSQVCLRTCEECAVCIHSYSCNCVDYLIKENICKHIHLCVMTYCPLSEDEENMIEYKPECVTLSPGALSPDENDSAVKKDGFVQSVLAKARALLHFLSNANDDDLSVEQWHTFSGCLDELLDMVTELPNNSQEKEPSNRKAKKRISFDLSEEKRLPESAYDLSSSSVQEEKIIFESLVNVEVESIHCDFDHFY